MVKFREGSEEYKLVARYIHELVTSLNVTLGYHKERDDDTILPKQLTRSSPPPAAVDQSLLLLCPFNTPYAKCLPRNGVSFDRQP